MPAQRVTPSVTAFSSRAAVQMASAVLAREGRAVLVDPGILPDELDAIEAFLLAERLVVDAVVYTHAHWDHVGGGGRWPTAATWAHPDFPAWLALCEAEEPLNDARTRAWAQAGLPAPDPLALPAPTHLAGDGATLPLGPTTLYVHALPGHLGGSIGVELVDEGVVVCGDMLDSVELPLPLQDPRAYLVSLGRLAERLESGVDHVVPGHGPPLGRAAALRQVTGDRAYVAELLHVAEEAVRRGQDLAAAWAAFDRIDRIGRGDADREGEHRLNATEVLRFVAREASLQPHDPHRAPVLDVLGPP